MLNKDGTRELAYVVTIDRIEPIQGSDNCEAAVVGGWRVMVRKGTFKAGDLAVYFEIDSKLDTNKPEFAFLEKKHGKIKTQKYTFGGKGLMISQGLLMAAEDFGWKVVTTPVTKYIDTGEGADSGLEEGAFFLTQRLGVTYADAADNKRKANSQDKYKRMASRHPKLFKNPVIRKIYKTKFGKKILFFFFGKKKDRDTAKDWPVGRFPGVTKTDQERCENMPWILEDKTPFIVTQKCDGSSGTYILEKKGKNKFEFYVCSRNVRMKNKEQKCFYGTRNYYWEVAEKYHIQEKMEKWLIENDADWVCWQGEICAPGIQKNPHHLKDTHFYCFHWTDSINGRLDIVKANELWKNLFMEVVPIVDTNYILPDNFEDFKLSADGYYDSQVCEGYMDCPREGFVYYKTTDPTFSFKNVSRQYLLKH